VRLQFQTRGKQVKVLNPEGGRGGPGSMAPKSQKCNILTWRFGIEFNVLVMWRAAESLSFKSRCRMEALRNVKPLLDIMNSLQPKQEV